MSAVLVGIFDTRDAAAKACGALIDAGFSTSDVATTGDAPGDDTPAHEGAIARFFHRVFGSDDDAANERRAGDGDAYTEAFRRGRFGVAVTTSSDDETDQAEGILNGAGAVDIDAESEAWRAEGWTGGTSGERSARAASNGRAHVFARPAGRDDR